MKREITIGYIPQMTPLTIGEAVWNATNEIERNFQDPATGRTLAHLLKNKRLIPRKINRVGVYLIASDARTQNAEGRGYYALARSKKGWYITIVYDNYRYKPRKDFILVMR